MLTNSFTAQLQLLQQVYKEHKEWFAYVSKGFTKDRGV